MPTFSVVGRIFFAVAIVAFGLLHFRYGAFVTRAMPEWPSWIPGGNIRVYAMGLVFVVLGAALFSDRYVRRAAFAIAGIILAGTLLLHVPRALADPAMWGVWWTNAGKGFALTGSALILAGTVGSRPVTVGRPSVDARLIAVGRFLVGAFFVLAGVEHFVFIEYVPALIPTWIPGAVFWTYASGVALVALGLALQVPAYSQRAALCSGLMIFAWILLLHLPRAFADLNNSNEATAVFEALAFSGIAFVLARNISRTARTPLAA